MQEESVLKASCSRPVLSFLSSAPVLGITGFNPKFNHAEEAELAGNGQKMAPESMLSHWPSTWLPRPVKCFDQVL